MRKSEANKISDAQLKQWAERNREPGTLACVPVIMINTLTGDKPGIIVNLASGLPLDATLKFLKAATGQIEKQMQVEGN